MSGMDGRSRQLDQDAADLNHAAYLQSGLQHRLSGSIPSMLHGKSEQHSVATDGYLDDLKSYKDTINGCPQMPSPSPSVYKKGNQIS
jgi:hypothetical protein